MKIETKMPDVIYAGEVILRGECIGLWNDTDVEGGIKYHHDNIHQAVIAERDTLKALCEQMAGAIKEFSFLPMESATKDGTEIIGVYDDCDCEIFWSERPVCMLGPVNGGFPQGWATCGPDVDSNLPMDEPNFWRTTEVHQALTAYENHVRGGE